MHDTAMSTRGGDTAAGIEPITEIDAGAVSTAASPDASGDSSFDLSLRLLTMVVVVALAGSISLLLYRWLGPRFSTAGAGPIATKASRPAPEPKAKDLGPAHVDQVLMDPGRVFKCEDHGKVSFSDEACASGSAVAPTVAPTVTPAAAPSTTSSPP
jgi:hypothetical protein